LEADAVSTASFRRWAALGRVALLDTPGIASLRRSPACSRSAFHREHHARWFESAHSRRSPTSKSASPSWRTSCA